MSAQLQELLQAATIATNGVNARGDTMVARLQDVPPRAEDIATHGVRRGAATALTLAQLESGENFLGLNPQPTEDVDADEVVELELAYDVVAADIAANVHPASVVNRVFDD